MLDVFVALDPLLWPSRYRKVEPLSDLEAQGVDLSVWNACSQACEARGSYVTAKAISTGSWAQESLFKLLPANGFGSVVGPQRQRSPVRSAYPALVDDNAVFLDHCERLATIHNGDVGQRLGEF